MRLSIVSLFISILSLSQASTLKARNVYTAGGWGLIVTDPSQCPAGTTGHSDNGVYVCCPTNFDSVVDAGAPSRICCPPGTDCMANFEAAPSCADSTWTLWNATIELNGAYYCCLPGQVGVQTTYTLDCSGSGVGIAASLSAQNLGQPTPKASAGATGATGTSTGTSTGGNLFSTLVGIVTHHSDSRRVEPRAFSIPLTGIVGCGVAALSFLGGFILMLGA